jgi:hypothetical protein
MGYRGRGKQGPEWAEMKMAIEALTGRIPQIRTIEVGNNVMPQEAFYDGAIYSEFSNEKYLETYMKHPEHVKVVDFVRRIILSRIVVDYQV